MAAALQLAAVYLPPSPLVPSLRGARSSTLPSCRRRLPSVRPLATIDPTSNGAPEEEPQGIDCAFISPRLLPDGTPDIHYRPARGGQKLRDIMLDNYIDLYGPYAQPLGNCAGGGTCGTCIVEVVEGKELLSLRTDVEKEKLKKNPKTWRLACQVMVGKEDSTGPLVIQQLPEWKAHEWQK